jgi:squalene synthase HpnC
MNRAGNALEAQSAGESPSAQDVAPARPSTGEIPAPRHPAPVPTDFPANFPSNFPANFPATVRAALAPAASLRHAHAATRAMALSHYENFSVVSMLLPGALRQDFCNVYAFCRAADDLGDELHDQQKSLHWLGHFKRQTHDCFNGVAESAVFVALADTVRRHDIPIDPFTDLIDAFQQDQRVSRYQSFDQLLDYCRRSANPVGRLVLYLCGYREPRLQELSDKTCTALQLTNFWQDVRRDLADRDRIYLPKDSMDRFGVDEDQIRQGRCDENYRRLIRFEVDRAAEWFSAGDALPPLLRPAVRRQVELFSQGGRAILSAIRRQGYDTLTRRPRLSRWQKGGLVLSVIAHYARRSLTRAAGWEPRP